MPLSSFSSRNNQLWPNINYLVYDLRWSSRIILHLHCSLHFVQYSRLTDSQTSFQQVVATTLLDIWYSLCILHIYLLYLEYPYSTVYIVTHKIFHDKFLNLEDLSQLEYWASKQMPQNLHKIVTEISQQWSRSSNLFTSCKHSVSAGEESLTLAFRMLGTEG